MEIICNRPFNVELPEENTMLQPYLKGNVYYKEHCVYNFSSDCLFNQVFPLSHLQKKIDVSATFKLLNLS